MIESSETTPPAFFTYIMYNITKKNPTFEGDESSSTSENAEESQTAHSMHSAEKTLVPTEAKHSATSGAYTTVLPKGSETMPQSSSTSDDSAISNSATLTRNTDSTDTTLPITSPGTKNQSLTIRETRTTSKHISLKAAKSYRSTVAGEHRTDTVTSSLSSLDSGESSKNSELTNAEQPTTSRADATVTTTSAKSKEHLFLANGASAVRRSTTAEPPGNTNTRIHHASSVTMSVSSAYTIHSTEKAAEGAKTEHPRTSSDTTLDANFVRTHEWPTIQKTGAISNLTISESTEGTKTALTSRRGEPRGNSSSAHGRKYLIWEQPAENTNTDAGIHHTTSVTMPVSSAQSTHSTSEASELADTEQSPTSDNSADLFTTFKTTRQSPSAHSSSASGGSTALERARSTTTNKYHTSIATMSVPPHRTVKSTMKPSDLSEFMQSTGKAAGRTAVVTRSVTTPSPTSLYNASITSKSPSVKPTKSVTTGKYHTPSVASSDPSSLSTYSTENISGPIEVEEPAASTYTETMVTSTATSRQPSLVYRPNLSENSAGLEQEEGTSTVTGRTKTMPQSTLVASILTETPPLEPGTVAKKHDVNTATTSLPPSHSVKSSKTPSELGEPKQQIMTSSVDATLGAPNYGPVSQWFSVYTTATTKEAKTKFPGRSTRNTDTTKSTESYTATSQPKIYKAGVISMITSLGAAKSTTTSTMAGEHHATAASLLSSYRSVGSSKNLQDLKEAEQALTNTTYKRSSPSPFFRRADYQKKSTEMESASKFSTREYRTTTTTSLLPQHHARSTENPIRLARPEHSTTSADADSYYADTVGTSQFVTPVTTATSITSDAKDTEEAATTTNATTVITRSKAMPHSYPIPSARIGKKSTTLVKNTSTSTDAETLISSTESVSRLRSYGDVYEKQTAKVTKAKSAVTSEMEAPAKIEEATPRHHGDVQCNLNIFSLYNLNDYLNGFGFNQTVDAGETIGIGCQSSGEHKNITLICGKTGLFDPDPSKLNCSSDIKTPMTTRELKSCEQCDAYGTESCEMKADGVVCHCYEHWSGKTCWRAADQCEITPLQCGKHGVCRSEVDYASCACDYGFTGEHCSVTKAKTTIISPHKSSGHLASEASVFVLTWYDIVILVIKAVLLIHSPSDGQVS
uniref:EGF-like domain-containing protein n=1 Tax=Haemonchus contortus TaxID=6289 RepID=A0A7I4YLA8_HAECO